MAYKHIFLATAQEEYESSIKWYYDRSMMATEQFIESVDRTLALICEHPDRWRNEYSSYYELGVKQYPYSIIYTIEEESEIIVIHSIYHHSRNPQKKYRK